jgi:tetratricopeptide (TPR) repeat protein
VVQTRKCWSVFLALGVLLACTVQAEERPLKSFPEAARASFLKGSDLQTEGHYQEALDAYHKAINLGLGEYPRVYLRIAFCYNKLKDPIRVIEAYSRFLEDFGVDRSCLF